MILPGAMLRYPSVPENRTRAWDVEESRRMTAAVRAKDEQQLIERAQQGDIEALESLLRAHADAVYAHALRFFGEPASADDALQEVFLKVFRSIVSFDGNAAFSTWLFRVTRNTCLDMVRAGKRRPVPVDPFDLVAGASPDHSQGVIEMAAVQEAMRALQPEDREALGAVTLFGLSYEEAADALEIPAGTVKSRVFRARRTLVALIGDRGGAA